VEAHHFHVHNYIKHKELTFHVRMPRDMSIADGHTVVSLIENEILRQLKIVATIHMEPIKNEST
jgi:divalent metal cation (Fe/Co/Zn/Cd) transporter